MTGRDIMPFGKYGKFKMGENAWSIERVKRDDPRYVDWLTTQLDFAQKNPALYEYFKSGKEDSTPKEVSNINTGDELLNTMGDRFRAWWKTAYGERMRTQGEMNYIPFLRVAIAAWTEGAKNSNPQVAALPPHIPAPTLDPLKAPLPKAIDNRDEEINF